MEDNFSKRKTFTEVCILPTRQFQYNAHGSYIAHPNSSFSFIVPLLGKQFASAAFQEQTKVYRMHELAWEEVPVRGTVGARVLLGEGLNSTVYMMEEVLGMIVRNAKESVARAAEEQVSDCVATVPPYFGGAERYALFDALKIGKANPLGFVSENLAAALKYVLDGIGNKRNGTNETVVVIFNMGARSTKVSVIKQYEVVDKKSGKKIDAVKVLGEAWDEMLGGKLFDLIVADIIVDKFDKLPQREGKPKLKELSNQKGWRRVLRKAEEIKEKLSAAKFMHVYLDNIADYTDINVLSLYS